LPTTLTPPKGPREKYTGGQPVVKWFPEAATQSFKEKDFVYRVSGKVTICAAAGNDVGNITILGRAMGPATGVTDTEIPIEIATDQSEFLFTMYHGTPASAVTAVTDPGTTLPLRHIAAGHWGVNKQNDGTNDRILVTEVAEHYDVGEQYGYVWGKVLAANRELG
jgi:hypothetical protein